MREYDFDGPVDRRGTQCIKWDHMPGGIPGALPMWVADMDLPTAPEVTEALSNRAAHGIFGYTYMVSSDWQAVIDWYRARHGLALRREWLLSSPGVICSLRAAVDALTAPGDRVVIQTPVYPPFFRAAGADGRVLTTNPLIGDGDGRYRMDFAGLEASFREGARVMILCSPHNPVGRVWTREELSELAALCVHYDVRVVSDEIHCDIVMPGTRHTPLLTVPGMSERTVALYSSTKTFNLAGLQISTAVVPDPQIRAAIARRLGRFGMDTPNLMAITAQTAAYRFGGPWLDALIRYIDDNAALLSDTLVNAGLPCAKPEGTYLVWADCARLCVTGDELVRLLAREAGVAVSSGEPFGTADHIRFNVAMARCLVERAASGIGRMVAGRG